MLKKREECHQIITAAKKRQEAEANKNASILLEQLDYERKKEEQKRAALQKKRDKKKQKKKKKTTNNTSEKPLNGDVDDEEDIEEDIALERIGGFSFITAGFERAALVISGAGCFISYSLSI